MSLKLVPFFSVLTSVGDSEELREEMRKVEREREREREREKGRKDNPIF